MALLLFALGIAGIALILMFMGSVIGQGVGEGIRNVGWLYLACAVILALVSQVIEWKRMGLLVLMLGLASVASAQTVEPRGTPWWATSLTVAGPLADGMSTVYAINQSGPNARIVEGNGFYHKLFGSDVKPAEIIAFKVGQAALFGAIVHAAGKQNRKAAIGVAILTAGINFWVSSQNVRNGMLARDLNRGRR